MRYLVISTGNSMMVVVMMTTMAMKVLSQNRVLALYLIDPISVSAPRLNGKCHFSLAS